MAVVPAVVAHRIAQPLPSDTLSLEDINANTKLITIHGKIVSLGIRRRVATMLQSSKPLWSSWRRQRSNGATILTRSSADSSSWSKSPMGSTLITATTTNRRPSAISVPWACQEVSDKPPSRYMFGNLLLIFFPYSFTLKCSVLSVFKTYFWNCTKLFDLLSHFLAQDLFAWFGGLSMIGLGWLSLNGLGINKYPNMCLNFPMIWNIWGSQNLYIFTASILSYNPVSFPSFVFLGSLVFLG